MTPRPPHLDEGAFLERLRAHDEEAWVALLHRYAPYVYAIATRGFALSPGEAEEVLQETMVAVVRHLPDYRGTGPLSAWIGRIARNAALQHLRRRERRPAPLGDETPDEAQETALRRVEEARAVWEALEALSPECREPLRLFYLEGRRYEEIAQALGVAPGTVASRLARCLVRLRHLLLTGAAPGGPAGGGGEPPRPAGKNRPRPGIVGSETDVDPPPP